MVALEIDDPKRFANPGKLASYCGLVPSLYSSGGKSWQGGIGRMTNGGQVRFLLCRCVFS